MTSHGKIDEYLDGALGADDEVAFLDHLADCAACQDELHAAVQLRDREDQLRAVAPAAPAAGPEAAIAPVRAITSRRARWLVPTVALAAAAAAAAWIVVNRRATAPPTTPAPTLALAPTRGLEARLSWSGAAGYRSYDALRAGAPAVETLDPRAIAALTERGDCAGVAAAYLLGGELTRADRAYAQCPDSPELLADRAALALAQRDPAAALALTDRALEMRADHAVARWNRALALRDLGLGLTAAAAFERAAEDPAWAAEARARATALRATLVAQRDGYAEVVAAGRAMVGGGPPISTTLARAFPARARLRLDDAIRVATSQARLDELRPLAEALEGLAGDGLVARLTRARPTTAPAALVARYVAWVEAGTIVDDAAWRRWHADAVRARADQLVVGAMLLSGLGGDDPAMGARLAALEDPWVASLAEVIRAGAIPDGETRLAAVEDGCARGAIAAYPCLRAAYQRAQLEFGRYRAPATATAAATVLAQVGATGEWAVRWRALYLLGGAERIRGNLGLVTAYYDETVASSDDCPTTRVAATIAAELAVHDDRVEDAVTRLRARPTCGAITLVELALEVELARRGHPVRPAAEVVAALAALAPTDPRDAAFAAYQSARVRLATEPAAAAELRAMIAPGRDRREPGRPDTGQLAAAAIAVDDGRASRWDEAIAAVSAALPAPTPTACGLVLAAEGAQTVAIAIDARGQRTGVVAPRTAGPLPPDAATPLVGCPVVDVLALPPWLGAEVALDPAQPWRFVTRAPRPAPPGPAHRVIVVDPRPPADLGLAPLAGYGSAPRDAELLRGEAATRARVTAAARDATVLELHAHTTRVPRSDAPALVLSDAPDGWAATAEDIATWGLRRAPVVLLADCDAAIAAGYDELYWGLPRAFLDAGARAVVAARVPVPDAEGAAVFASLGDAVAAGESPAIAIARIRAEKIRQDPTSWLRHVVVFE